MKWMTRLQIDGRRLQESWVDLCPDLDLTSPPAQAEVVARRTARNNAQAVMVAADDTHVVQPWTDDMQQAVYDEVTRLHRQAHRDLFPLSPNLTALIFNSTADLSHKHRSRTMDQYRVLC